MEEGVCVAGFRAGGNELGLCAGKAGKVEDKVAKVGGNSGGGVTLSSGAE